MASDDYEPLRRIMSRFGARGSPEAFYWAVNDAYHTAEAPLYDDLHSDMFQELSRVWQRLLRHLPPGPQRLRILDVGCGTGLVGALLGESCPQRIERLTCLDPCQAMLDRCRERSAAWGFACSFVRGDIDAVQGAARFDVITIDSALHHIVCIEAFCRRAVELLAGGGVLLTAQDPRAEALRDRVYLDRSRRGSRLRDWLKRTVVTPVRDALRLYPPDPPLAVATNRPLLEQGVIVRPMNIRSIYAVTDFHVPGQPGAFGQGLSIEKLGRWLEGMRLIDCFTYQYFGRPWSRLSEQQKSLERQLWDANDPHGQLFASAWAKPAEPDRPPRDG